MLARRRFLSGVFAVPLTKLGFAQGPSGVAQARPVVRNIDIRDVTCKRAKFALNLPGFPNAPIRDIRLERCTFDNVSQMDVTNEVPGLVLNDVKVNGKIVKRG